MIGGIKMVWLKMDSGLGNTYKKLIIASGADVDWQGEILIQNNTIILPGSINSLIFDFELKKVYPNIIDIPEIQGELFETEGRKLLANIFNLLLYVFGKWGALPGIRISHSYARIDLLFKQILKEINSEVYYSNSGIKFTTNGLSVVFEDIIISAINKLKADDKAESERLQEDASMEESSEEKPQGLWHDMKWKVTKESFKKQELNEKQVAANRLGSNFYMIRYTCPICSNNLHMSVYPNGKEFAIDTEEGKVYIARVYMCPTCNKFYTPRPKKLLSDGDIYILDFDNDTNAVEDYKKLIGRRGKKTSNSNFNMYETEYMDKVQNGNRSLAKICSRIETLSDEDLESLLGQMDEGFFSDREIERFMAYIEQELEYRKNAKLDSYTAFRRGLSSGKIGEDGVAGTEYNRPDYSAIDEENEVEKTQEDDLMDSIVRNYMGSTGNEEKGTVNSNDKELQDGQGNTDNKVLRSDEEIIETKEKDSIKKTNIKEKVRKKIKKSRQTEKNYKIIKSQEDNNTPESENTQIIEEDNNQHIKDIKKENNNQNNTSVINSKNIKISIVISKETVIKEIKASRNKKYADIQKLVKDIENSSLSIEDKEEFIKQLQEMLEQSGKKELDYLISNILQNDSKEHYKKIKERIKSYKEIDTSKYEEIIDEFIQNAERAELSAMVKKAGTKDRRTILDLMESLKNTDFDPDILKEYTDKLYNQVKEIDTETIYEICPNVLALDVEDGIYAMQKIEEADVLPELKSEMTALIDKRLTHMKVEESEQLVEKLKRSLDNNIEDNSKIHYYSARKMQEGDNKDDESILIRNAISKYAILLGKYEYPVLICDASLFGNGKDGFIITPDHIFYKGMVKSGQLDVIDIEEVSLNSSRTGKSIFINKKSGSKIKLPCSLKGKDQKNMALALNDFVAYLKIKPKSRSIEYMSQKKHAAICCYRCGHVFKEGNICPKCGSRN